MQADKTTINDLSIFHPEEEQSVFHHLDFTTTSGGRSWFRHLMANPHTDVKRIHETQQTLKLILQKENNWPKMISNGTVMVVQRFYDSQIDEIPAHTNSVNSLYYRILKSSDYSLIRFSVIHFIDFTKGLRQIVEA